MKKLLTSPIAKRVIYPALTAVAMLCTAATSYIVSPIYIDGSTNTQIYGTNTNVVCVVKASTTNYYMMPGDTVAGDNTNLWPQITFPPGNNISVWRYATAQYGFTMGATNGVAGGTLTFRFASSQDFTHWVSNAWFFAVGTNGTAGTFTTGTTNLDSNGNLWYALQSIENTFTGTASNLFLVIPPKPSL